MTVPTELHELVERFERDLLAYRSAGFNEALDDQSENAREFAVTGSYVVEKTSPA